MKRTLLVMMCMALALASGVSRAQTEAAPPPPATEQAAPAVAVDAPAAEATTPVDAAPADPSAIEAPAAADATATDTAAPSEPAEDTRGLDEQIQQLKQDVVDLNKDLFVLEEELLFPANTQVAVFISMDVGEFFALDSIQIKVDNKEVANYLYTPREAEALLKGGVHRIYVGNLKVGEHELVAFFNGKGPNNREYRRGANLKFEKSVGAKYLELKITDRARRAQPEFAIKDWE
jgi:hypothetical protein